MTFITKVTRSHSQIIDAIREGVESTGAITSNLRLYARKGEYDLELAADMMVNTTQGDNGYLAIEHDQIIVLLNDSLAKQGYSEFARNHTFTGSPDASIIPTGFTDISGTIYYDLANSKNQ